MNRLGGAPKTLKCHTNEATPKTVAQTSFETPKAVLAGPLTKKHTYIEPSLRISLQFFKTLGLAEKSKLLAKLLEIIYATSRGPFYVFCFSFMFESRPPD